jgi:hypothetical protein
MFKPMNSSNNLVKFCSLSQDVIFGLPLIGITIEKSSACGLFTEKHPL